MHSPSRGPAQSCAAVGRRTAPSTSPQVTPDSTLTQTRSAATECVHLTVMPPDPVTITDQFLTPHSGHSHLKSTARTRSTLSPTSTNTSPRLATSCQSTLRSLGHAHRPLQRHPSVRSSMHTLGRHLQRASLQRVFAPQHTSVPYSCSHSTCTH